MKLELKIDNGTVGEETTKTGRHRIYINNPQDGIDVWFGDLFYFKTPETALEFAKEIQNIDISKFKQ